MDEIMDEITVDKITRVPFRHAPGGVIMLEARTIVTEDGFAPSLSIYPVTIVQARYGGTYEGPGLARGGSWLAFPVGARMLMNDPAWESWCDSDIECAEWWDLARKENWPVGHGESPSAAYVDLIGRVCVLGCVEREDFSREPTWWKRDKS